MRKLFTLLLVAVLLSALVSPANTLAEPDAVSPGPAKETAPDVLEGLELIRIELPAGAAAVSGGAVIAGQQMTFEQEPNNTWGQPNWIAGNSAVIEGNIYPNADEDWYAFTAPAGARVYAATMTSFSANSSTDSLLSLYDAAGTLLEEDDNDGSFGGSSSSIAGTLLTSGGTYYLRVIHSSVTGQLRPYRLYLNMQSGSPASELEPNNDLGTANPLPLAGWVSGVIAASGAYTTATDTDFYTLTLNAGDTVYLSLDLDPERDGITWNGRLGLGLFSNFILVGNDASISSPNSEAYFLTVKNAGTYYVYIDAATYDSAPTYTYRLSASVIPAAPAGNCSLYGYSGYTPLPDSSSVVITVPVSGHPRIADIDVSLTISHSNPADLDIVLESPGGSMVGLVTDIGSSSSPQWQFELDDEAALPANAFAVLYNLRLQPEYSYRLSWFDGIDAGGDWKLHIYDDTAGNTGGLTNFSLSICQPPPETGCPASSTAVTLHANDFEAGIGHYAHSGTADEWELGLPSYKPISSCASGSNCFVTDLDSTYDALSNQKLESPLIDLTNPRLVGPVTLSWAMKYQIENATFDHAWVEVIPSVGGAPQRLWEWLDATMTTQVATPTITLQESAGWGVHTADLTRFIGSNVTLRWHLDSDNSIQLAGLAVDDVVVSGCLSNDVFVPLASR